MYLIGLAEEQSAKGRASKYDSYALDKMSIRVSPKVFGARIRCAQLSTCCFQDTADVGTPYALARCTLVLLCWVHPLQLTLCKAPGSTGSPLVTIIVGDACEYSILHPISAESIHEGLIRL